MTNIEDLMDDLTGEVYDKLEVKNGWNLADIKLIFETAKSKVLAFYLNKNKDGEEKRGDHKITSD